jgi:heme/copper-type cytochrome/quinol oxidase subunit 4
MITFCLQTVFSERGDVMRGLQKMVEWFLRRTDQILEDVHFYLRLLFALYVVQLVIIFYCFMFLNTTRKANAEIENARVFVFAMPTHAISVSSSVLIFWSAICNYLVFVFTQTAYVKIFKMCLASKLIPQFCLYTWLARKVQGWP